MTRTSFRTSLRTALALMRAFASERLPARRRVPSQRVSRPAVEVTSDFGVAPIFPGMR